MSTIDLTCEGRLEVSPFVSERKLVAMREMIKGINYGGYASERAATDLKETLATTDGVYSFAHLTNIRNLPAWDKAERQWTKIAAVETVDDFDPVTFQRLAFNFDTLKHGKDTNGKQVSPRVAELDTYQYAFGYTEETVKAAIEKRGFKFGLSLERILSSLRPIVRDLPGDMLEIALDTDEFLVFDALQTQLGASSKIAAGTAPVTGGTVAANSPFSVDALRLGLSQIGQRKVDNRRVKLADRYYIVVASGQGETVEAALEFAKTLIRIQDGNLTYGTQPQGNLGRIAGVIESEWITSSTFWAAVPAAGSTRRPSLVKLQLTGRTAPEVLVNNFTGTLLRGGNGSSPFDLASFDADAVDLKLRQFTNSALITQEQVVWSPGA